MSTWVPKDDTATLHRVEDRKSDKHPEFEGEFKIVCPHCGAGQLGWIKAWVRESQKTGAKFFSIAFKHRQKRDGQSR